VDVHVMLGMCMRWIDYSIYNYCSTCRKVFDKSELICPICHKVLRRTPRTPRVKPVVPRVDVGDVDG
jgi:rRNA maturation endonuclease Nob1